MPRHHMTSRGPIPFSPEEEAEWDAKAAEESANRDIREAESVRAARNRLLAETDWVAVKSAELAEAVPADWASYRGFLRDIPRQPGFPWDVVWPQKPE